MVFNRLKSKNSKNFSQTYNLWWLILEVEFSNLSDILILNIIWKTNELNLHLTQFWVFLYYSILVWQITEKILSFIYNIIQYCNNFFDY